jgi:hypothetical protein
MTRILQILRWPRAHATGCKKQRLFLSLITGAAGETQASSGWRVSLTTLPQSRTNVRKPESS